MHYIGIAILWLIALSSGGCSLYFLVETLQSGAFAEDFSFVGWPIVSGFLISGACFALLQSKRQLAARLFAAGTIIGLGFYAFIFMIFS